jgi:hypothetical protein
MIFRVEIEREDDGRWIGEVTDLPGVLAYGATADEAAGGLMSYSTDFRRAFFRQEGTSQSK